MRHRLDTLSRHFEHRSKRERLLVCGIVLSALYGLWDMAMMNPELQRQKTIVSQIQTLEGQLNTLDEQIQGIVQHQDGQAEVRLQQRIADLRYQLDQSNRQEEKMISRFIPPRQMPHVLQDILKAHTGLRLITLESLDVVPIDIADKQAAQASSDTKQDDTTAPSKIYRHGLQMTFQGDFFAIMSYIKSIESLPWQLYWDQIEYTVQTYPDAQITITTHTLSMKEAWIGV